LQFFISNSKSARMCKLSLTFTVRLWVTHW
jgi:hypothetical protein